MSPEQKKEFFNTRFTIKGNIHYTRGLFTPQANKEALKTNPNAPKKYSTVFSWNPQDPANRAALDAMYAFMTKARQTLNPTIPDQYYVWPVKQYDTYRRMDGKLAAEFLQGKHWMNMSSGEKYAPKIVDRNMQTIIDQAVVFSGVEAAVSFSFYDMGAGNSTSKKGLGVNIIAVMVLGGGTPDPIGEFNVNLDEVFGGFQADMNQPMGQGYGQQGTPGMGQGYGHQPVQGNVPSYNSQAGQVPAQQYSPPAPQYAPQQQGQQYAPPAPQQQQYAPQQPAYSPPQAPQAPVAPQQPQYAPPGQTQYAPPAPQGQPGQQYNPQQGQHPGWAGPQN